MISCVVPFTAFSVKYSQHRPFALPAAHAIPTTAATGTRMLYHKMGQAGVSLVYPENLSITDKEADADTLH